MNTFIARNETVPATHTSKYDFTLHMNEFIASDEIVSAIYLQIQITLQTNMFIASDEYVFCTGDNTLGSGDKHLWHWKRMCFTLEMNTIALEMNVLKMHIQPSATNT